jgi:hypothetical protein
MNQISGGISLRKKLLSTIGDATIRLPCLAGAGIVGILIGAIPDSAKAFNLYDGSNAGNNLEINLSTTISYTGLLRVNNPSKILAGPTNANGNDGDSNFQHGLVGNLFEAVPVLDIRDGDYGAHFSGQFYLNTSYLGTNQNSQPGTLNSIFVSKNTDFTSATRNVDGENAQLLDAFVFGQHQFGDQTLQLKLGRQVLFWGQSLFFASDDISGGQAPINVVTADNTINPQSQQVFMPVGQAVLTYQPTPNTTIQGYYQFEWEHDYFEGAGSYFNGSDILDKGGQSVIVGNGQFFLRNKDLTPPTENGQFGLSVQQLVGTWDLGLYGMRFDAKAPAVYAFPGQGIGPIATAVATGEAVGRYQLVYPRDIWLEGASFSTNFGAANVAGELSARQHQPLVAAGFGMPSATNPGNANSDPLYPVGNTLNASVSAIYTSSGIPLDPGGVAFEGEVVLQHVIAVTSMKSALAPGLQATAAAFDIGLTPTYFNVLPNLTVTFPIGLRYGFLGRSEIDSSIYHGTGTLNVGITGTWRSKWIASLNYQDYLGKPNPTFNDNADRGFVSLNLQYSF